MSIETRVLYRGNTPLIGPGVPEPVARHVIWKKIIETTVVTDKGCWEWTGNRDPKWGYGVTGYRGTYWRLHRLVWTLAKGEIPEGHVVRHKCDNGPCCNPDHLELGTDAENVQDRMARGRDHHANKTECPRGHPYSGENLYVDSRGFRHCRACLKAKSQTPEHVAWRREYQRKKRLERKAKKALQASGDC